MVITEDIKLCREREIRPSCLLFVLCVCCACVRLCFPCILKRQLFLPCGTRYLVPTVIIVMCNTFFFVYIQPASRIFALSPRNFMCYYLLCYWNLLFVVDSSCVLHICTARFFSVLKMERRVHFARRTGGCVRRSIYRRKRCRIKPFRRRFW